MKTSREEICRRLVLDLIGPGDDAECLEDRPTDRYLTGFVSPPQTAMGAEEDQRLEVGDDGDEDGGGDIGVSPLSTGMRPSSIGISFALESGNDTDHLSVRISCGLYDPVETAAADGARSRTRWQRRAIVTSLDLNVPIGVVECDLESSGLAGFGLYLRSEPTSFGKLVTVACVNKCKVSKDNLRNDVIRGTAFQFRMEIAAGHGTRFKARPVRTNPFDFDGQMAAVIYGHVVEYATGHNCAAGWSGAVDSGDFKLFTDWLPVAEVANVNPNGGVAFSDFVKSGESGPLSANWLAHASTNQLIEGLTRLVAAYRIWIKDRTAAVEGLAEPRRGWAKKHMELCVHVADRMDGSVGLLRSSKAARIAFRAANMAMASQHQWTKPKEPPLRWRPFQLGFMLTSLTSLADPSDPNRETMDLLWFPTGGGKTEAYLALTAFVLILGRLQGDSKRGRFGTVVLTRYTLRLLTVQQFQRASALVLACDQMRLSSTEVEGSPIALGEEPFGIGLWVGGGTTPNRYDMAKAVLVGRASPEEHGSPDQLTNCPCCNSKLQWRANDEFESIEVRCTADSCELSGRVLPIWTVDADVYRNRPSVLIGTADKFAQIVRNPRTAALFGVDGESNPPELIIQDELHLISGPLGTLAAVYEVAIDALCTHDGKRPKILGSTATIRRAEEQVKALFDRNTCQFPPPGLHADDSCFAVIDPDRPTRMYVGVPTIGRSPKFVLQAVCASLVQSASVTESQHPDAYWTLVAYFNSLRELGGALVLMQDDVNDSIVQYAGRSGEKARNPEFIEELTSRRSAKDIKLLLNELKLPSASRRAVDVLLATNMISVGVDISRLGLMVVNGQPKGIAEYIQATSRVGRAQVPGLIVTVYNFGKSRDRSHFESFRTWHAALYRDVEATSVTPFASRARDRALHAAVVAMIRYLVPGMRESPNLDHASTKDIAAVVDEIVRRVSSIDGREAKAAKQELEDFLRNWRNRRPAAYWDDHQPKSSLLESAEQAAARRAVSGVKSPAQPTLNSLRAVEPSSDFRIVERLKARGEE